MRRGHGLCPLPAELAQSACFL
jgi:hypothetical protein